MKNNLVNWVIDQHVNTNHMYDTYLPYEFHLRMVVKTFEQFKYLLDEKDWESVELACWGHDLIEDTRTNYNAVNEMLGKEAAEMIRAVTNYSRGRNRNERMPDFVYEDIVKVPNARFVKLCDRIANVQYSRMTGSSMFHKYKSENEHFLKQLNVDMNDEMVIYLNNILN